MQYGIARVLKKIKKLSARELANLDAELRLLRMSELQARARDAGCSQSSIDDALDAAGGKQGIVLLVLQAHSAGTDGSDLLPAAEQTGDSGEKDGHAADDDHPVSRGSDDAQQQAQSTMKSPRRRAHRLGGGWYAIYDGAEGVDVPSSAPYFWHKARNVTQWDPPPGVTLPAPSTTAPTAKPQQQPTTQQPSTGGSETVTPSDSVADDAGSSAADAAASNDVGEVGAGTPVAVATENAPPSQDRRHSTTSSVPSDVGPPLSRTASVHETRPSLGASTESARSGGSSAMPSAGDRSLHMPQQPLLLRRLMAHGDHMKGLEVRLAGLERQQRLHFGSLAGTSAIDAAEEDASHGGNRSQSKTDGVSGIATAPASLKAVLARLDALEAAMAIGIPPHASGTAAAVAAPGRGTAIDDTDFSEPQANGGESADEVAALERQRLDYKVQRRLMVLEVSTWLNQSSHAQPVFVGCIYRTPLILMCGFVFLNPF